MTILAMQESGRIQVLYNKWWRNTGVCVSDDKKKDSKASSLGVANVGGIFVVLFVGLALAVIVAALEFVWNNRRQTSSLNRLNRPSSVWSDMMEELRFAVRCHGSTKKPKLRRHCSQCGSDDGSCTGPGVGAAGLVGEPSPNGVLLAQSAAVGSTVRRPSVVDDARLHYRRSARVDCDYTVDRRRSSMRCASDLDYADRRPSATSELRQEKTSDRYGESVVPDSLARSFVKV